MQLLAKFKQILYMGLRATLNFRKFMVALNPMYSQELPVIGQFFDTMIVASIDKVWL